MLWLRIVPYIKEEEYMKKGFTLILAIFIACSLVGCGSKNDTTESTNENITEATTEKAMDDNEEAADSSDTTESTEEVAGDVTKTTYEASYSVEIKVYTDTENHHIEYPVISGWDNTAKQDEWNKTFYDSAVSNDAEFGEEDGCNTSFAVTEQTDSLLCIVGDGYMYYADSAHPSAYMISYNIDMTTGESTKLANMADIDDIAEKLVAGTGCKVLTDGITLAEILDYNLMGEVPTKDLLVTSLGHFDGDYTEYGEGELWGSSYMENGKARLILSVPHALGDYVVVAID